MPDARHSAADMIMEALLRECLTARPLALTPAGLSTVARRRD
jgi:hypothetical protein